MNRVRNGRLKKPTSVDFAAPGDVGVPEGQEAQAVSVQYAGTHWLAIFASVQGSEGPQGPCHLRNEERAFAPVARLRGGAVHLLYLGMSAVTKPVAAVATEHRATVKAPVSRNIDGGSAATARVLGVVHQVAKVIT